MEIIGAQCKKKREDFPQISPHFGGSSAQPFPQGTAAPRPASVRALVSAPSAASFPAGAAGAAAGAARGKAGVLRPESSAMSSPLE